MARTLLPVLPERERGECTPIAPRLRAERAEELSDLLKVLADPTRPPEDVARDADRKPGELLSFTGVRQGMKIAELAPGGGYFTRILTGAVGTSGHVYRQTAAFTLETQHYPDSPHHMGQRGWPSVVLNPGHTFHSTTIYQFGVS